MAEVCEPVAEPGEASRSAGATARAAKLRCLVWLQAPTNAAAVVTEWLRGGGYAEAVHDVNHAMDALQESDFDLVAVDGTAPGALELLLLTRRRGSSPTRSWVVLSPNLPSTFGQKVLRRAGIAVVPLAEAAATAPGPLDLD